jgi:hypothetical protein
MESQVILKKRNKTVLNVKSTIEYIAKTANTKQEMVNRLSDILPSFFEIGFGGSHVWCSNQKREILFVIYL